jgi:hypothetical protein
MKIISKILLPLMLLTLHGYSQKDSTIRVGIGIGMNYTFWQVNGSDLEKHNASYHGIDLSNSTFTFNQTATPSPSIKLHFENGSRKNIKFFTSLNLFYSKLLYEQYAETFYSSPLSSYKKTSTFKYTITPFHTNLELGSHFNIGRFYSRIGLNADFIYLNEIIEGFSIDSGMKEEVSRIKEKSLAIAGGTGITVGYYLMIKKVPVYWEFKTAYSICSYSKANIVCSSTHLGIKF